MTNELFVDGICEIDDKTIGSYFSRFGSRITHYESHRHRPTNSCCFALISFESHHTVNAILRQRPHLINFHSLFVKRVLPPGTCSFIERLLPVSSLFVHNKSNKEFDEQKLRNYFSTFGQICKFERDYNHDRLFIEYNDYDSVDKIFLNKNHLPNNIDIHKNILPRAQSTIEYHGTCRRKQQEITIEEKKKQRHHKKKSHTDEQYQDLLQKTIGNLINCKAQLRNTENDYVILQMKYTSIKEENEKLNQLLDNQNKIINSCLMCQEHEITIVRLQQTLLKLNEQYDTIKSQYQRLLSTQHTPVILSKPERDISTTTSVRRPQFSLSTRLNNDENSKYEVSENYQSQFNLPTPAFSDIVTKQQNSPSPIIQSRIQQHRIIYKYNSVKSDED